MGLGDILGSISPAFGLASGNGIFGNKNVMGSISPLYGLLSGGGLFGSLLGGHNSQSQPAEAQQPGASLAPQSSGLGALLAQILGGM